MPLPSVDKDADLVAVAILHAKAGDPSLLRGERARQPDHPLFKSLDRRCCRLARTHWVWGFLEGIRGYLLFFFFALFMPTPAAWRGMVDPVGTLPVFLRTRHRRGEVGLS